MKSSKYLIWKILSYLSIIALGFTYAGERWQHARSLPQVRNVDPIMVKVKQNLQTIDLDYALPSTRVVKHRLKTGIQKDIYTLQTGNAPLSGNAGEPLLPTIPVTIVLPKGKTIENVRVIPGIQENITENYTLAHAQKPFPLKKGVNASETMPDSRIYNSDNPYPLKRWEVVSIQSKNGIKMAVLKIYPVIYKPKTGSIIYSKTLKVVVNLTSERDNSPQHLKTIQGSIEALSSNVENSEALSSYGALTQNIPQLGICNSSESYRYVIITSQAFRDATNDYTVRDLIANKQVKGISSTIVTTETIFSNYSGVDNAEKVRNFIIDAYNNWETEFVLLGGDINVVPMRKLWCTAYAGGDADHIPSDLYYQCLDGNYNSDNDTYWGETTDGPNGTDIDLFSEINIGRASAENTLEMSNFVYKTISYENDIESASYLRKGLTVGEQLGFGGASEYASGSMEELRLGSNAHGYVTSGFASSPVFTTDTLYDSPFYTWALSELTGKMNSGNYSIINHLGHANYNYVMKLYNNDADALTNNKFFFAYSQGCIPGDFESDCIGEHFTTSNRHGAYAVVFNSRYGWGTFNSTDGPSQRYHRQFWDAYFSEYMINLGKLNADSHEDNAWNINSDCMRWCYYESNLLGDPQTPVRGQVTGPSVAYAAHTVFDALPGGNNDGIINPGEDISISLSLKNIGSEIARAVRATITSSNQGITILNSQINCGDIACCGATLNSVEKFTLRIQSSIVVPNTIPLQITMTDNAGHSWETSITLLVNRSVSVSGIVRNMSTGLPISNATIRYTGPSTGTVTTGTDGYYNFSALIGTYLIHASATPFFPESTTTQINNSRTDINFLLGKPDIAVNPRKISPQLNPNFLDTVPFYITNNGSKPLTYSIQGALQHLSNLTFNNHYGSEHFTRFFKGDADNRIGEPVNLSRGGPDQFGYTWIDSDEASGPIFTWNDIASTGQLLNNVSNCDDCYDEVNLGFNFPFYGNTFNTVFISSNGHLTFGAGSSNYSNYPLPTASMPGNLIAPFFDDLYPSNSGDIYFKSFGSYAIIQFQNVALYSGNGAVTFQVHLYQNGKIMLYYKELTATSQSATVGIQNGDQTVGFNVSYNTNYLKNLLAIQINSLPDWVTLNKIDGVVNPSKIDTIFAYFNALNGTPGNNILDLDIQHDDSQAANPISVRCSLYVDGIRSLTVNQSSIQFKQTWRSLADTVSIIISNTGNELTTVSQMYTNNSVFSIVGPISFAIPAGGSVQKQIIYRPTEVTNSAGALVILSDAEDNPSVVINLQGQSIEPPNFQLSSGSFSATTPVGNAIQKEMIITNFGGDSLRYNISPRFQNRWVSDGLWHKTLHRTMSGDSCWYYGIEYTWQYGNSNFGSLTTSEIQLPFGSVVLNYYSWRNAESSYDDSYVKISTDNGVTWTTIEILSSSSNSWELHSLNLSSYAGLRVKIQFYFYCDGSISGEGWYIDDVKINDAAIDLGWLQLSKTNGIIPPQGKDTLFIYMSSSQLNPGFYLDTLRMTHNSPIPQNPMPIPVAYQVTQSLPIVSRILNVNSSSSPLLTGRKFSAANVTIGSSVSGYMKGSKFTMTCF